MGKTLFLWAKGDKLSTFSPFQEGGRWRAEATKVKIGSANFSGKGEHWGRVYSAREKLELLMSLWVKAAQSGALLPAEKKEIC